MPTCGFFSLKRNTTHGAPPAPDTPLDSITADELTRLTTLPLMHASLPCVPPLAQSLHAAGFTVARVFPFNTYDAADSARTYRVYVVEKEGKVVQVVSVPDCKSIPAVAERDAACAFIKGSVLDNFTKIILFNGMKVSIECCIFGALKLCMCMAGVRALPETPENLKLLADNVMAVAQGVVAEVEKQQSKGKTLYDEQPIYRYCRELISDAPVYFSYEELKGIYERQAHNLLEMLPYAEPLLAKTVGRFVIYDLIKDDWERVNETAVALVRAYALTCAHDKHAGEIALGCCLATHQEVSYVDDLWALKVAKSDLPSELDTFKAEAVTEEMARVLNNLGAPRKLLRANAEAFAKVKASFLFAAGRIQEAAAPVVKKAKVDGADAMEDADPAEQGAVKFLKDIGYDRWFNEQVACEGTSIFAPCPQMSAGSVAYVADAINGHCGAKDLLDMLLRIHAS